MFSCGSVSLILWTLCLSHFDPGGLSVSIRYLSTCVLNSGICVLSGLHGSLVVGVSA